MSLLHRRHRFTCTILFWPIRPRASVSFKGLRLLTLALAISSETISDAGECGAVVNYSVPNSNNAECGTITCSPASGSFFPIGDTPVTCGSTAGPTCGFKITVNDTENPTITAPPDISVGNTPGQCSAT